MSDISTAEALGIEIDAYLRRGWRLESRGAETATMTRPGLGVVGHVLFAAATLIGPFIASGTLALIAAEMFGGAPETTAGAVAVMLFPVAVFAAVVCGWVVAGRTERIVLPT